MKIDQVLKRTIITALLNASKSYYGMSGFEGCIYPKSNQPFLKKVFKLRDLEGSLSWLISHGACVTV